MKAAKFPARSRSAARRRTKGSTQAAGPAGGPFLPFIAIALVCLAGFAWWFHSEYSVSLQSPVRLRWQWPVVAAKRITSDSAQGAEADQKGRLTAYQEYACRKFGADCRVALAIQRAENAAGKCEIYHYNTNGTLDWGYFQINTVHLKRPGLNLRDLLDCKANIDFAYQLYVEQRGFTPWSTFNSGAYRKYMGAARR